MMKFVYMGIVEGVCRHHFVLRPLSARQRTRQIEEAWKPGGDMTVAVAWCEDHIGPLDHKKWTHSRWSISITNDEDALAFRLTWSS
jgi:hypothetical protein